MRKLVGIFAAMACILQSGCTQCGWARDANAKHTSVKARGFPEFPKSLIHPIAFARYAAGQHHGAAAQHDFTTCQTSSLFISPSSHGLNQVADFCAPIPRLAGDEINPRRSKAAWQLPQTPLSFFWQQNLKSGQNLVLELLDSDGLPWPAASTISQKNNQYTIKLEPQFELPKTRDLFLVGTIYDQSGKKVETWLEPFSVNEGASGIAPWMPVPKVSAQTSAKNKSASKTKKSRRRR